MAKRMRIEPTDRLFDIGINGGNKPIVWHNWRKDGFIYLEPIKAAIEEFIICGINQHESNKLRINAHHTGLVDEIYELIAGIYAKNDRDMRSLHFKVSHEVFDVRELTVADIISRSKWEALGVTARLILQLATYKRLILEDATGFGNNRSHFTVAGAVAVSTILGFQVVV
jgi:hypothetical protein